MDKQEAIEMIKKLQESKVVLCEICVSRCKGYRVAYLSDLEIEPINFCSDFEGE